MTYYLTDTHCHITCDRLYQRIDEIMINAQAANIKRLIVFCCSFEEYERAKQLKAKYANILIAFGFHPSELYDFKEADYATFEQELASGTIDILGEIGLDYHWDTVTKEDQITALHRQLQLAKKYDLPISIHMRDATKDCMDILAQYAPLKGIMHCFSGSVETAKEAVKLGLLISFAGPLTFKNSRQSVEVAQTIDVNKLLVETDCPYLTPHPYRGKENEPMYVQYTFDKLSEIKGIDKEILAKQLEENLMTLWK